MYVSSTSRWHFSATSKLTKSKIKLSSASSFEMEDGASAINCHIELYNSVLTIAKGVRLQNVHIKLNNGRMSVAEDAFLKQYNIEISNGFLIIGASSIFEQGYNALVPDILISDGRLEVGNHNIIKANFWIRFGGFATIGDYNCINELTEIRCDERVEIGSFNLISYQCNIWDTNTHATYTLEEVEKKMVRDFPNIGAEQIKPLSKPVSIGSNVWIGKRATILKGSQLHDSSRVGVGAIVSGKVLLTNQTVVAAPSRIF